MVVGRLLTYWEGNFSGAMLNFGCVIQRINKHQKSCNISLILFKEHTFPNSKQIHLKISISLAIFDLFPQTAEKFSKCDRLISRSCHCPPFSSPSWTFPKVPVLPEVVSASLFYHPQSKKEVHRNQDAPTDFQGK